MSDRFAVFQQEGGGLVARPITEEQQNETKVSKEYRSIGMAVIQRLRLESKLRDGGEHVA